MHILKINLIIFCEHILELRVCAETDLLKKSIAYFEKWVYLQVQSESA